MIKPLILSVVCVGLFGCSSIPRHWYKVHTLKGHSDNCFSIAVSPDKRHVATGSFDGSIRVWNRATGECEQVLEIDPGGVRSVEDVAYLADGSLLAAIGFESCTVWSTRTWEIQARYLGYARVMAVDPHSSRLALGLESGELVLYDAERDREIRRRRINDVGFMTLEATRDFTTLVVGDDSVFRVSVPDLSVQWRADGHNTDLLMNDILISQKYGLVVTSSYDKSARVWDFETGEPLAVLEHDCAVYSLSLSTDGSRLLTTSQSESITWDASTWKKQQVYEFPEEYGVFEGRFSRDGTWVALADGLGGLEIWDCQTGHKLARIQASGKLIGKIILDEEDRFVIVSGWGTEIMIWEFSR